VLPDATEPKLIAEALSDAPGLPLTPVPPRPIVWVPTASVTTRVADTTPVTRGVNVTEIMQLDSGARELPQLLVLAKFELPAPLTATEPILKLAVPALLKVAVRGVLVVPTS
jgi:hypothetical protein